jgi:hypothetical protein
VLDGGPNVVAAVQEITKGGAHASLILSASWALNNSAGRCCARRHTHFIVGYGAR